MPAKGWQSLGEPLVYVSVRLQESLVEFVDDHAKAMQRLMPAVKIGRGDAMHDLIMLAQQYLQEEQQDPPAPVPVVLKPAPALPEPGPGLQHCRVGLGHPPFSLSRQECPKCANTIAARAYRKNKKQKGSAT